jgi:hypothetical protein
MLVSHAPASPRHATRHWGDAARRTAGAALVLLVACGRDEPSPATTGDGAPAGSVADAAPVAAPPPAPSDTACPMRGLWRGCSVVQRLERSGFAVRPVEDSARQEGLAIAGSVWRVGAAAELQLFLYADTLAARREADAVREQVDDARPVAVRGMRRAPTVIHSLNLVALFFNNDDHQLERVQLALTAGLPAV